jgi:hypothetical protein
VTLESFLQEMTDRDAEATFWYARPGATAGI